MVGELGGTTRSLSIEKLEDRRAAMMKREVLDFERLFGGTEICIFVRPEPVARRDKLGISQLHILGDLILRSLYEEVCSDLLGFGADNLSLIPVEDRKLD